MDPQNRLRLDFASSSDWCRCQPLANVLGSRGRHMKLTRWPCRRATCFMALRNSTMVSAACKPPSGAKVNSYWLGPSSTSSERSGRPSASMVWRSTSRIGST